MPIAENTTAPIGSNNPAAPAPVLNPAAAQSALITHPPRTIDTNDKTKPIMPFILPDFALVSLITIYFLKV